MFKKKEEIVVLGVQAFDAYWDHNDTWNGRERVVGHPELVSGRVCVNTTNNYVTLSIEEAEKFVKSVNKAIKKAKDSNSRVVAEGSK